MQTTVHIQGMSCHHCVMAVEKALKKLPDVKSVKVTIGEAVIETAAPPDMTRVRDAIQAEGYEVA